MCSNIQMEIIAEEIIVKHLDKSVLDIIDIEIKELPNNINARVGITRNGKNVTNVVLEINKELKSRSYELIESVIEHEVVHIATEMLSESNQGHNEKFFAMANKLGIETKEYRRV